MSVREWLIKTLSHRDFVPQSTIAAVVTHQYETASQALKKNNSVEISGFGKFYFNEKKSHKQMAKFLAEKEAYMQKLVDEGGTEKKRQSYEEKLKIVNKSIENLKIRNDEQITGDL